MKTGSSSGCAVLSAGSELTARLDCWVGVTKSTICCTDPTPCLIPNPTKSVTKLIEFVSLSPNRSP